MARVAVWISLRFPSFPQAMKGVTRMLGARVWDFTLIGLTHGRVLPPTLDQSYGDAHLHGILLRRLSAQRANPVSYEAGSSS